MKDRLVIIIERQYIFRPDSIVCNTWEAALRVIAESELTFDTVSIRPAEFAQWADARVILQNLHG